MSNNAIEQFKIERRDRIKQYATDGEFNSRSSAWISKSIEEKYVYNFDWLGRPIIQYPQDMAAVQELVWTVKPDLIIETGIAHGGSLMLSASMLALLDVCDAAHDGKSLDPRNPKRKVLGVDIDIRSHNRVAIETHPLAHYIEMIQGSSIAEDTISQIRERAAKAKTVMIFLDSNHTHDHVLAELEAYAPLVHPGSYCVVFDTFVEQLPKSAFPDRPWGPGDNPMTAVRAFLSSHPEFAVDEMIDRKLQITAAPGGYLRRLPS